MQETIAAATDLFTDTFGGSPDFIAVAPGRINLIGEHTDYNDGFVFPVAISQVLVVAARTTATQSKLMSRERGEGQAFNASTVEKGRVNGYASYVGGMAWALREAGHSVLPNVEAAIVSTIPVASGVSSSAAIEMAFGVLWNGAAGLGHTNKELALIAQRCENAFVGLQSGIMDQMASAMGREGQAMFIDTRTLDIKYEPVPDDLIVVLCDTGKPRSLTASAYNERRSQCEAACEALGVKALRDADCGMLDAARERMDPLVYKRAKHIITENARCLDFAKALEASDYHKIGELMRASHESLRDDYDVTGKELDAMAESCWGTPGCVGARMTGAGFGGACVALVQKERFDDFAANVCSVFEGKIASKALINACSIVNGAKLLLK